METENRLCTIEQKHHQESSGRFIHLYKLISGNHKFISLPTHESGKITQTQQFYLKKSSNEAFQVIKEFFF